MKILVPTDFSEFAQFAIDAAILIAEKTNGEIYLLHVYDPPNVGLVDLPSDSKYFQEVLNKKLGEMKAIENTISSRNISVRTDIFKGNLIENINYVDSFFNPDLILMGSHGVSGKEEWFIGSNTQKVVRKVHNKILVLKQALKDLDFKKACYVSNFEISSRVAFMEFLQFMKLFEIKDLDVLTIDTSSFFSQPTILMKTLAKEFKEIAKEFNVKVNFYQDYTVAAGVEHFTTAHDIDLIGISNKERHHLKRIFQGSNVEMIVNHSDIPVLSIDD